MSVTHAKSRPSPVSETRRLKLLVKKGFQSVGVVFGKLFLSSLTNHKVKVLDSFVVVRTLADLAFENTRKEKVFEGSHGLQEVELHHPISIGFLARRRKGGTR